MIDRAGRYAPGAFLCLSTALGAMRLALFYVYRPRWALCAWRFFVSIDRAGRYAPGAFLRLSTALGAMRLALFYVYRPR